MKIITLNTNSLVEADYEKKREIFAQVIEREKPDILGHFDLISKYGLPDENDPRYRKMATESLLACLEVTPIIEVNTGGIARGYMNAPFPASFLLDEIKSHGGRMILGADSHHVNNLTFYFDEAVEILRNHGFRSVVALKGGQFEEIGI